MKNIKMVFLLSLFFVTFGCRYTYKPDVYPKFESIPEFSSTLLLKLLNNQPSTKLIEYGSQGMNTWG